MNLTLLKVTDVRATDAMSLSGRDEEVPIALTRGKQFDHDLLYLSLVEGQVGLLELGVRASDGLLVSVTLVNVAKGSVTVAGLPFTASPSSTLPALTESYGAPSVDFSHWRPISAFEDRFITENANVRYTCYRDAISVEWAPEFVADQEKLLDGQVTWLLNRDRCLLGLVIRDLRSSDLAMFKASLV